MFPAITQLLTMEVKHAIGKNAPPRGPRKERKSPDIGTKKIRKAEAFRICRKTGKLFSVVADCIDRAGTLRFFAERDFFVRRRLLDDNRHAVVVVTGKEVGCHFTTNVAIDALVINIEFTGDAALVFVFDICHRSFIMRDSPAICQN